MKTENLSGYKLALGRKVLPTWSGGWVHHRLASTLPVTFCEGLAAVASWLGRFSAAKALLLAVFLLAALPVTAAERQRLPGHVPRAVARLQPVDRLAGTNRVQLAIGLPLRNRDALTNLLQQLYDPASAQFRQYLDPGQFTERFGPTEQDYQATIAFALANGLAVTRTHPNRLLLNVEAAAADIERTFGVTMRVYSHPTEARVFFAPDAEPSLERALPVLHISGLNNYTAPRPMNLREAPIEQRLGAQPFAGSGPGGVYAGKDFRAAYVPGTSLTGSGQAVGLFELNGYYTNDIATYRKQAGLPNVPLQNVLIDGFNGSAGGRRPGGLNEEVALDIEMAISMAPGLSRVLVYEGSPNATAATIDHLLNRMATDNLAKQLSCSWGFDIDVICQQIFQQYAAQGQSFFLASGDSGAFAGAVFQPSDDPYITVVGGTVLTTGSSGAWAAESAWNGSSGGISTLYPIPDWQQGIDMSKNRGSTALRNLPDVAMVAYNVLAIADNGRSITLVGTSIAAPLWAGFTALVNQQAAASGKPSIGYLNPALYTIGKGASYATSFHDITSGNNTNSTSPHLYFAVPGFDLCTGWGSPKGTALIQALLAPATEALLVTSPLGFTASGPVGGPFNLATQNYTLTNVGTAPVNWAAASSAAWLKVSPGSGTLTPGGPAATVAATLNPTASHLLLGTYTANMAFVDQNTGVTQNRPVSLWVGNGGFETGDFTHWTFSGDSQFSFADSIDYGLEVGASNLPGVDDSLFVHSGIYGAFLGQNSSLGSLSQKMPTVAGQRYLLAFWLANPARGTPNEFRAAWNGNTLLDLVNAPQFAWKQEQFIVAATGSSTVLQFRFRNDQNAFGLDDISVQPIPPPMFQAVTQTNGTITLTWNTLAGLAYQVQYSTDLASTTWNNLGNVITATGATATATDAVSSAMQRTYRVVLLP